MVDYLGQGFDIDYEEVMKWIHTEPESFEKEVMAFQLERYKN